MEEPVLPGLVFIYLALLISGPTVLFVLNSLAMFLYFGKVDLTQWIGFLELLCRGLH